MGVTPFHSYEMKDLIAKINDGRYTLNLKEPITIECSLFLIQCLQSNEADRIPMEELQEHPFISKMLENTSLTEMQVDSFIQELSTMDPSINAPMKNTVGSTNIEKGKSYSCIYSTKNGDQHKILVT